jgi:hypothetical protein
MPENLPDRVGKSAYGGLRVVFDLVEVVSIPVFNEMADAAAWLLVKWCPSKISSIAPQSDTT